MNPVQLRQLSAGWRFLFCLAGTWGASCILVACLPSYDVVDGMLQNTGGSHSSGLSRTGTGGASIGSARATGGSSATSSGSATCTNPSGANACVTCLNSQCCKEANACSATGSIIGSCTDMLDCLAAGAGMTDGEYYVSGCLAGSSIGATQNDINAYNACASCAKQHCATACPQ
jgi:hypothetical protein